MRSSWLLGLLGLLLVVGGGYAYLTQRPERRPATVAEQHQAAQAMATDPGTPQAVPGRSRPGMPVRVVIPTLDVDAKVLPIKAPGGTLVPPSDPLELGWWSDGALPGAARGSALIAGHTVHTGGGALDDLEDLRAGDPVRVRTTKGLLRYTVTEVHTYRKGRIARDAEQLFSQEVPGRLVLLTCEDWTGTEYLSNNVVVAKPAA